ncbi:hypothetical protein ABT093_40270, partial [Kitasatospora sp. NPDC002551]|uniref:hypothetical protein n=1 Tax=Kitasatospora sp. NPDC002551 TaxID=3154539 RepID=UPI0033294266
ARSGAPMVMAATGTRRIAAEMPSVHSTVRETYRELAENGSGGYRQDGGGRGEVGNEQHGAYRIPVQNDARRQRDDQRRELRGEGQERDLAGSGLELEDGEGGQRQLVDGGARIAGALTDQKRG